MPKSSREARPKKGRQTVQPNTPIDFKLADFADAAPSVATGRMKKSVSNAWKTEAKQLIGPSKKNKDQLAWDEKDLSDFEPYSDEETEADQSEETECGGLSCAKMKKKCKKKKNDKGQVYPIDLWYLIGNHVAPESVATFSAICRGAHFVTHTIRFWNNLYRAYYNSDTDLPQALQPHYMDKTHGLRARVVRSLFLLYPPFIHRVKSLGPFQHEPDVLEGAVCELMWHQRVKSLWHFFFKFKVTRHKPCPLSLPDRREKLWHFTPDITHNPEDHRCVLEVVTCNFISLPIVMGYVLRKAFVSVGHAMRYHKVKLMFTQHNVLSDRYMHDHGVAVVMDPVVNLRLLYWWDPAYPGNAQQHLISPSSTTWGT